MAKPSCQPHLESMHQHLKYLSRLGDHMTWVGGNSRICENYIGPMFSYTAALRRRFSTLFCFLGPLKECEKPRFPITQLPDLDPKCKLYCWMPYNVQPETGKVRRLSQTHGAARGATTSPYRARFVS